jgi:hypothetical protein
MRSIDPMAQPPPPPNMSAGYQENLPVPPILSSTPYPRGHNPSTVLPSSYGISSPDAMARYALPPDPLLLQRQPKKVRPKCHMVDPSQMRDHIYGHWS